MCQSHETGPGQYRLGADRAAFVAKTSKQFHFVRCLRTKRSMSALARDHMPATIRGQERRHTQTGTGTEHDFDTFAHRRGLSQRPRVSCAETRQRPRYRFEIVQHAQLQKSEPLGKFAAPQSPARAIGKHDLLPVDRPRHGHCGGARARAGLLKVVRNSRIEAGDRIIMDYHHALERSGGIPERKPALAAADISEEGRTHHGYPDYNHLLANGLPHRQAGIRIFPAIAAQ